MSYTTPFTAVAGTAWKASDWNTYGRDNIAWQATDSPACRVYHNTTQSIANSTIKSLVFNSERYDNSAMHSTSSNTARITMPTGGGGKYLVGMNAYYASVISSSVWFELNGTDTNANPVAQMSFDNGHMLVTTAWAFSAADFVTTTLLQISGGAVNITHADFYTPEFWAFWCRT